MKVCTGAKSEDNSKLAARKYARIIQKLGFEAKFTDFKIQVCARFSWQLIYISMGRTNFWDGFWLADLQA